MTSSLPARALALLVAVGLVVGAVAYRNRDSGGLTGSTGSTSNSRQLHLACTPDIAETCRAAVASEKNVDVIVESTTATLDRLTKANGAAEAGINGWITSPAWADEVRTARQRASLADPLVGSPVVIARSRLVEVADSSRAASLTTACGETPTWKCLGDSMTKRQWSALPGGSASWGSIKVGWDDPSTTVAGLATFGAHSEAFFGRTDFDALDIDSNDFTAWSSGVAGSVKRPFVDDSLTSLLTAGPASYGWVVTTQARATTALAQAARAQQFQTVTPTPEVTVDMTYVPVGTNKTLLSIATGSKMKNAFVNAGWLVTGKSSPASLAELPPNDNLPASGVLMRLHTKWQQELSK